MLGADIRSSLQHAEKAKEPIFLPTLGQTNNETNEIYIEK